MKISKILDFRVSLKVLLMSNIMIAIAVFFIKNEPDIKFCNSEGYKFMIVNEGHSRVFVHQKTIPGPPGFENLCGYDSYWKEIPLEHQFLFGINNIQYSKADSTLSVSEDGYSNFITEKLYVYETNKPGNRIAFLKVK